MDMTSGEFNYWMACLGEVLNELNTKRTDTRLLVLKRWQEVLQEVAGVTDTFRYPSVAQMTDTQRRDSLEEIEDLLGDIAKLISEHSAYIGTARAGAVQMLGRAVDECGRQFGELCNAKEEVTAAEALDAYPPQNTRP